MRFLKLITVIFVLPVGALAHGVHSEPNEEARLQFAALERSRVTMREEGEYRLIESNGIPNHSTGQFPGRGNPHSISVQRHRYKVPLNPKPSGSITEMQRQPFGVAINGIPFDPGTAECFGLARGQRPSGPCEWSEEAIVGGVGQLGLDGSNAHVQPNGTYHYHGIPRGLVSQLSGDVVLVGYAADGFAMMVSKSGAYQPSYRLKAGNRPSGPGGRYTGKYTQDYVLDAAAGHLDRCNGTMVNGRYVYFLTEQFPFVPRCWRGEPDSSFARQGGQGTGRGAHPQHRRPPPHHHRRGI